MSPPRLGIFWSNAGYFTRREFNGSSHMRKQLPQARPDPGEEARDQSGWAFILLDYVQFPDGLFARSVGGTFVPVEKIRTPPPPKSWWETSPLDEVPSNLLRLRRVGSLLFMDEIEQKVIRTVLLK